MFLCFLFLQDFWWWGCYAENYRRSTKKLYFTNYLSQIVSTSLHYFLFDVWFPTDPGCFSKLIYLFKIILVNWNQVNLIIQTVFMISFIGRFCISFFITWFVALRTAADSDINNLPPKNICFWKFVMNTILNLTLKLALNTAVNLVFLIF